MQDYIENICYALIVISMFKSVMPNKGYTKMLSLIVGLILLTLILKPFDYFIEKNVRISDITYEMERKIGNTDFESDLKNFEREIFEDGEY
ncbi:MAG: hypothetical protein E7254_04220 [Lachnospiraceae bacterium]|nr:hypothetical protein [Lachnospiraceae bacterium]